MASILIKNIRKMEETSSKWRFELFCTAEQHEIILKTNEKIKTLNAIENIFIP